MTKTLWCKTRRNCSPTRVFHISLVLHVKWSILLKSLVKSPSVCMYTGMVPVYSQAFTALEKIIGCIWRMYIKKVPVKNYIQTVLLSTAKQGDNALGSIHPSICLSVCLTDRPTDTTKYIMSLTSRSINKKPSTGRPKQCLMCLIHLILTLFYKSVECGVLGVISSDSETVHVVMQD